MKALTLFCQKQWEHRSKFHVGRHTPKQVINIGQLVYSWEILETMGQRLCEVGAGKNTNPSNAEEDKCSCYKNHAAEEEELTCNQIQIEII